MPFDEYEWVDKKEILTFEEITKLANLFVQLGADKIRLTGGEPLVVDELPLLAQAIVSHGMRATLLTNGFHSKSFPFSRGASSRAWLFMRTARP